jgi:hypothetical protein
MRALTHSELLEIWENGQALHPLDQGLLSLHVALPELRDSAADWPIGRRNGALAELHSAWFGPALRGWTGCPECGEKLEFGLDAKRLAHRQPQDAGQSITFKEQTFRLPTSRDLAKVTTESDPRKAAIELLERCRLDSRSAAQEEGSTATAWDERDLDAIGEQMALADPLAEIALRFDCPACGSLFDESLDLAAFVWAEIEGRAKRLLLEVHSLASAYGWSEAQILSLSAARRESYLALVRA